MINRRVKQIIKYGWAHAKEAMLLSKERKIQGIGRLWYFGDILYCYRRYRMWSNQYMAECFYALSPKERRKVGEKYYLEGIKRDSWEHEYDSNLKFFIKYGSAKYSNPSKKYKRQNEYAKRYHAGRNLMVESNVFVSRHHYLCGDITIGNNVYLAGNVHLDYSGGITIEDDVQITNGVVIETHAHDFHNDWKADRNSYSTTHLTIHKGAVIGTKAIILPGCSCVGFHSRIGAGAVVTKNVPDYTIVAGCPAKIIKVMNH